MPCALRSHSPHSPHGRTTPLPTRPARRPGAAPCRPASSLSTTPPTGGRGTHAAAVVLWDLDNVRPPAGADPVALLQAVARGGGGGAAVTLFANAATAAALPPGWDPPPGGAELVTLPSTPGAVDRSITSAAVRFVTEATAAAESSPASLTVVSSDAAAFTGLLRWASASAGVATRVIGTFPGGRTGQPDAWRARPLPAAADEAVQWGEVVNQAAAAAAAAARGGGGGERDLVRDER